MHQLECQKGKTLRFDKNKQTTLVDTKSSYNDFASVDTGKFEYNPKVEEQKKIDQIFGNKGLVTG